MVLVIVAVPATEELVRETAEGVRVTAATLAAKERVQCHGLRKTQEDQ
jgi:hypothetical protein